MKKRLLGMFWSCAPCALVLALVATVTATPPGGGGGWGGWAGIGIRAAGAIAASRSANNNSNRNNYPQYQQPRYQQPQYQQPYYQLPAQPAAVEPSRNAIPVKKTQPLSNSGFLLMASKWPADQIRRNEAAIETRLDNRFLELDRELKAAEDAAKDAIIKKFGETDPNKATGLIDALRRGDADNIRVLTAGQDAALIGQLVSVAEARRAIDEARRQALRGTFTGNDRRRIIDVLVAANPAAGAPDAGVRIDGIIAAITLDALIRGILGTAVAGNPGQAAPLNRGAGGQMIIVPQLAPGQIIDLGNGAVLVGGGPGSALQVSSGSLPEAMGIDVAPGEPVSDSASDPVTSGIVLANAKDSPEKVNYTISGRPYACDPGFMQPLTAGQVWPVAFDRGGTFGRASYSISVEGTYTFTLTDKGWELFRQAILIKLDNSANVVDFHYVFQNKQEVLPAGEIRDLSSPYAIGLEFDDGTGAVHKKKLAAGTYKIALAADERSVDLFEPGPEGVFASRQSVFETGKPEEAAVLFAP
jgi:hypothetical protein